MTFLEELTWRGLLFDAMPGAEEHFKQKKVSAYIGFDPTAPSLTIGNLVPIMMLVHLQRYGHRPVAVVGGSTGMIGDPSGKSSERNLLDVQTLRKNQENVKIQLSKFISLDSQEHGLMLNNFDWMKDYTFLDFLRDVGKHLSVNYMMAKDSVKSRLETGLSFTEFSYQLLQAFDFYWLFKHYEVTVQMGGSDQWGNMTAGTELIRRMAGGEAWAITCPLVTKADGTKFGKSEKGNVWLDRSMTSPYHFYQFWLNTADEDAEKFIKIYTLLEKDEIERIISEHQAEPHLRVLQKALAKEVTCLVHSEHDYLQSIQASDLLFGKGNLDEINQMDAAFLEEVFQGLEKALVLPENLEVDILDLVTQASGNIIFSSKGEARKMILGNGFSINKKKVTLDTRIHSSDLLLGKYLLAQKGKKDYYLITI